MNLPSRLIHAHRCRHRGFTLAELLVSVAVVLVLAVVLGTVGAWMMSRARETGCVYHIRSQLVGLLALSSDHGRRYYWPAADTAADNAPEFLYPDYVGSLETFICPATKNRIRPEVMDAKTGKPRDLRNNAAHAGDARGGHSYEYFGFYTIPPNEVRLEWIGDKFFARKRPDHPFLPAHETVLVLDGDDSGINNFPDASNNRGAGGWHWGFADGHVRWISAAETKDPRGVSGAGE
jgi:prepilin-type N-terminal cleavage/methylation domain-containing protein